MNSQHKLRTPVFTISLDFELMWGVFDKRTIADYGSNVKGVHQVIPKIVALFRAHEVHATWAAIGCLYYKDLNELQADIPVEKPMYLHDKFSAYSHLSKIDPEYFPIYYSGINLIKQLKTIEGQEIGTHTFSHYYCLEEGQDLNSFRADIKKAVEKAKTYDIETKSIIFPRNQYNEAYLKVCREEGILGYRGNEDNFIQRPRTQEKLSMLIRALRFADTHINITGHNVYSKIDITADGLVNIPASFFFRPYSEKRKFLEFLKVRRYKKAMLSAARSGSLFHLWWHPHNFGCNQEENLFQLKEILEYYKVLNKEFGMRSLNMSEIANEATNQ